MKKVVSLFLIIGIILPCISLFVSCSSNKNDEDDGLIKIVDNGESKYTVVRPDNVGENVRNAVVALRTAINDKFGVRLELSTDYIPRNEENYVIPEYEILVGDTNREESVAALEGLTGDRFVIKAVGKKIIICGATDKMTEQAVGYFIRNFVESDYAADTDSFTFTSALNEQGVGGYSYCISTGLTFEEMASQVYTDFRKRFWNGTWVQGSGFWDAAEILETFIDAYEATKEPEYLEYVKTYAKSFEQVNGRNWLSNSFNDDVMWITIAYLRIYLLTGETSYYTHAKSMYDGVYKRAWDTVNGGMFWKTDNKSKNSCINCPAAIAASLIAQISKEEKYNTQAKEMIDWVVANLYGGDGYVYDSVSVETGKINNWASTYNQGTFIGACTLIYQNTNDEKYMGYADDAVKYTMVNMFKNGVINSEGGDNGDLHGFKGILTRWIYRYAIFKNDRNVLEWLQLNAATAYSNRNSKGLIWTTWADKTEETMSSEKTVFGYSTAVALMFNSLQWWTADETL